MVKQQRIRSPTVIDKEAPIRRGLPKYETVNLIWYSFHSQGKFTIFPTQRKGVIICHYHW